MDYSISLRYASSVGQLMSTSSGDCLSVPVPCTSLSLEFRYRFRISVYYFRWVTACGYLWYLRGCILLVSRGGLELNVFSYCFGLELNVFSYCFGRLPAVYPIME